MTDRAAAPSLAMPYMVMLVTPLFFSTNIIFGRFVADETDPFVLATVRWSAVALILLPFAFLRSRTTIITVVKSHWRLLLLLGFLGMGICGGGVYWGLQMTTATNATLIYSTAPILIIFLERLFKGRTIVGREVFGAILAFFGVGWIVLGGDVGRLATFSLNPGDLLIAFAALSWAGYSILYRDEGLSKLDNISLFAVVAVFGALANLPFAAADLARGTGLPETQAAWWAVGGIIVIASLVAFSGFQYGVRALGASLAGLFMYLMTPFGVALAVIFLGERLELFHVIGIVAVMVGVGAATFPAQIASRFGLRSAQPR